MYYSVSGFSDKVSRCFGGLEGTVAQDYIDYRFYTEDNAGVQWFLRHPCHFLINNVDIVKLLRNKSFQCGNCLFM